MVVAFVLSSSPPTQAVPTTVGQNFAAGTACDGMTIQTGVGSGTSYTFPSSGTVTSWSTMATSAGNRMAAVVWRPAGLNAWTLVGSSSLEVPTGAGLKTFTTNIAVQAGDVLAQWVEQRNGINNVNGTCSRPGTVGTTSVWWYPATPRTVLADDVLTELSRAVEPGGTVYLVGGTATLSVSIDAALRGAGFVPIRVAGADRYETAVAVADVIGSPSVIYEVAGSVADDAIMAGAAAAADGGAVLFSSAAADAYTASHQIEAIHAVGVAAASAIDDPGGVVAAARVPDALVAVTVAGARRAPLVLVPASGVLPAAVTAFVTSLDTVAELTIVGGIAAITNPVVARLERELRVG